MILYSQVWQLENKKKTKKAGYEMYEGVKFSTTSIIDVAEQTSIKRLPYQISWVQIMVHLSIYRTSKDWQVRYISPQLRKNQDISKNCWLLSEMTQALYRNEG